MKDINNIEDWYREELNNYHVEPDNTVWDSLSEDLDANSPLTDDNISEWYKKEVVKLEERPDYTVWEKLSTKLDTTSVWDKLVISLNRYDQFIWWRNLVFRGTAVFLLLFGSYLAYNNYSNNNNQIAVKDEAGISNKKLIPSQNIVANSLNSNKSEKLSSSDNRINASEPNNENFASIATKNNKLSSEEKIKKAISNAKKNLMPESSKNELVYASIPNEPSYHAINVDNLNSLKTEKERNIFTDINGHQLTEYDITHLYESGDFLVKKDKNKIVFNTKRFSSFFIYGLYARRIYVGVNAGIKKQGMITNLKKNSELTNYNQTNFLDFGSNIGATVGFIVSDKFNLESNVNFNSSAGYKRAFNAEGISYQENLNLNYTSLNLLAKKMNTKSTFDNKVYSINFIGGIYAGYLRSAYSDANGVYQQIDSYRKTDFGVILGIEQDRYISKTIVITPGIRYNQGLLNIANKNNDFQSARNFSLEFNLGVKYVFLKKGN